MKTFLIILFVCIWLGGSLIKSVRKQLKEGIPEAEPAPNPTRPAYESLFDDASHSRSSFADEERAAGYYTYEEYDPSEAEQPVATSAANPRAAAPAAQEDLTEQDEAEPFLFDLRQAVIYQSILAPKYQLEGASY